MSKTYEQRIQEYAQKHRDKLNSHYCSPVFTTDECEDEAKVTCAAVAEGIILREFDSIERYKDWLYHGNKAAVKINNHLIDNGYVPKPE